MIQEIGEGRFNPAYMRKNPQEDDILLHYEYNKVMLIKEGTDTVSLLLGI